MATVPDISDSDRLVLFTALAAQTDFAITWPVFGTSDADAMTTLRVTVDGVEETDWTFVGTAISGLTGVYNGGTFTRPTALTGGEAIVVWSDTPAKRDSDFIEGADFPATTQDRVLNRLFATERDDQQRREAIVRRPFNETTLDMKLPTVALRSGKYFAWGPTGLPVAVGDATTLGGVTLVDLAAFDGAALIGYKQGGSGSVIVTVEAKLQERVSVKDFGPTGGGVDDTIPLDAAFALSDRVTVLGGDWVYRGTSTPDVSKIAVDPDSDLIGMSTDIPITVYDEDGKFIGIQHNHNELKKADPGPTTAITTGALTSPPLSRAPGGPVDVAAFWFNNDGLEWTRDGNSSNGNVKWYTWEWIHTDSAETDGYEADRHPSLGFYRGDDATILDWQCYWLKEAGVTAVILIGINADYSTWSTFADAQHWKYQLFNNVPNFKGLKYILPIVYDVGLSFPALTDLKTEFDKTVTTIMSNFENAYTIERDGKDYVVFFIWDGAALRVLTDNGSGATNLKALFAYISAEMQTLGYDGAAFLTRDASTTVTLSNDEGYEDDWIYIWSDYSRVFGEDHSTQTTYQEIVDDFASSVPANFEVMVPSIVTSHLSHSAHPSSLNETGHTPELFRQLVQKAANYVNNNRALCPNLITVYNVAEWAEAGPGLQPNVQDGFGYLDALREGISGGGAKIRHGNGQFTATLTGCTTSPTGDVDYVIDFENGMVHLTIPAQILGTSNTTAATLTGMPTVIRPADVQVIGGGKVRDNGSDVASYFNIATSGVITLNVNVGTAFTNTGSKGVRPCTISYRFR